MEFEKLESQLNKKEDGKQISHATAILESNPKNKAQDAAPLLL
jgi:hypothetical protein